MSLISFEFTPAFLASEMRPLDMEVVRESSTFNFAYNAEWGYTVRSEHETWPEKQELKKALLAIEESDRQGNFF